MSTAEVAGVANHHQSLLQSAARRVHKLDAALRTVVTYTSQRPVTSLRVQGLNSSSTSKCLVLGLATLALVLGFVIISAHLGYTSTRRIQVTLHLSYFLEK